MSNVLIGEFIGTMLLVLLGDGVCANVTLNNSGFKAAGPLFIALGWGLAVCLPAAAMGGIAENFPASYNPALTVALAAGGFVGAILVWIAFKPQFDASSDLGDSLRGIFCTAPGVRNIPYNILQEAIATFWLVFAIKAACGAFPLGTFGVFLVIVSCGTTFGGLTGYAMNAARDTAPRLAFAILPIKGKGDADWAYGLTAPLIGPFIGALVAVALYAVIPWM